MSWIWAICGIVIVGGLVLYGYQTHQAKIAEYAESVRVRIKAQGGQDVTVDKIDTPHLTGVVLFAVGYTDVNGRQILNRVTVHTVGEYKFKQFWGEPVTPV